MYKSSKVVVYDGEKLVGEVEVYYNPNLEVNSIREKLKGGDKIRISYFTTPSERCSPLAVLHTITSNSSGGSSGVCFKLESNNPNSQLIHLHTTCLTENKTAVASLGGEELHLVAMRSRRNGLFPCFWGFIVQPGLYESCLVMLNLRCLGIVFDLDETLIVANTLRSFEDRIEALQRKVSCELDPQRLAGMLSEIKRYQDDRNLLKQYAESDQVIDSGKLIKAQSEVVPALSDGHQSFSRPLIRLPEKNIILTRINPTIRDTSVLVRLRPAWEDLRSYLMARGRKRFEVYVCTMAERDYALEMWRLLDPDSNLISVKELLTRVVCVKSGLKKSLYNVFQDGNCHPKMALVIDDRLKVWDERDQPRVHVVPAFAPYYAPQAEANSSVPILCVARNVACNVRGGFFKDFDDSLLQRVNEVAHEDDIKDILPPDVSNYLISEEVGLGVYNVQDCIPFKVTTLPEALKEGKKQVAVDYIAPLGTKCKPAPVLTPQQVIEQQSGISTTEKFLGTEVGQNSISGGEFGLLVNSNDENGGSSQHKNVQENGNGIIHRSLQSQPLAEKMLKALSLFKDSSGAGILAQFWVPIKEGDTYILSTCEQPYLLDQMLAGYREVSRGFKFSAEVKPGHFLGLPGRVFTSKVPEWTSNVAHYNKGEYLRLDHALSHEIRGSIALPVFEDDSYENSCCAVLELVTMKEKSDFSAEMDHVCRALETVNLKSVAPPRLHKQCFSKIQMAALTEITDVLRAVCHAHRLPVALTWIPCRYNEKVGDESRKVRVGGCNNNSTDKGILCIETDACYVSEREMQGFVQACSEHHLEEGQGIAGKALQSNRPFFFPDVKEYHISQYPLVQHARKYGLNAAVAIRLRSIYSGGDDYILEFFLPASMKGSTEQQLLLNNLLSTMQMICKSLRTVSDAELSGVRGSDVGLQTGLDESRLPLELSRSGSEQKYMEETSIPADQISENATDSTDVMLGARPPDQRLFEFLETFPTYILYKKPETEGAFWIFCSKDEGSHYNSSLGDLGTRMIYDKIKSAFSKVCNGEELIVQFWAPITSGNRLVLSTSGQPFAISVFGEGLEEYRGRCVGYECNIDMNNDNNKVIKDDIEQHQDRHPMTMISGPPTTAFLNRLPEAVLDTKNHREGSLMRYASNCGLWTSYILPIGCPSQYHSSCIGVVECSSLSSVNLEIVNTMKRALEQEGLNVFNVQDRIPYNTIHGLTLVRDEIQVALKSVCELHKIGVAQVWISYEDEIRVPFSFSSVDTQTTRRLALKLTGYNSGDEDSTTYHWRFKEYYDACDMVPLKMGEELVGKTLHDYQPRFCENISELGTDTLMGWVSTDDVACSGFTICMSIDTGDFNCAFEFIWHHTPNYVPLLEALLLTLKRRLPRFNFASGAELGDQLHVIDVDNSTESETEFFKIFKEKGLSPIPEAIDKGKKAMVVNYNARSKEKHDTTEINLSREDIEQHYGKTMKKAAEDLGVSLSTLKRKHNKLGMSGWQGPDLPQRKTYNSNKNQRKESHTHEKDNGVIQDPSPVKRNENTVIKAEYEDDIIKIRLGNSEATFVTVENEIGKKFKMKNGTFKIKYLDEDEEWILMTSDQDLSDCIQNSRRMRVLLHNQ